MAKRRTWLVQCACSALAIWIGEPLGHVYGVSHPALRLVVFGGLATAFGAVGMIRK